MASLEARARARVCVYKMTVKLSVQPTVANGNSDAESNGNFYDGRRGTMSRKEEGDAERRG